MFDLSWYYNFCCKRTTMFLESALQSIKTLNVIKFNWKGKDWNYTKITQLNHILFTKNLLELFMKKNTHRWNDCWVIAWCNCSRVVIARFCLPSVFFSSFIIISSKIDSTSSSDPVSSNMSGKLLTSSNIKSSGTEKSWLLLKSGGSTSPSHLSVSGEVSEGILASS